MIDDARWVEAIATLPAWCSARCFASTGTVELEWDREAMAAPYHDAADVRAMFFLTLGGEWILVDRQHRFKTIVCCYRRG